MEIGHVCVGVRACAGTSVGFYKYGIIGESMNENILRLCEEVLSDNFF